MKFPITTPLNPIESPISRWFSHQIFVFLHRWHRVYTRQGTRQHPRARHGVPFPGAAGRGPFPRGHWGPRRRRTPRESDFGWKSWEFPREKVGISQGLWEKVRSSQGFWTGKSVGISIGFWGETMVNSIGFSGGKRSWVKKCRVLRASWATIGGRWSSKANLWAI